jgi:hypothetical protein
VDPPVDYQRLQINGQDTTLQPDVQQYDVVANAGDALSVGLSAHNANGFSNPATLSISVPSGPSTNPPDPPTGLTYQILGWF